MKKTLLTVISVFTILFSQAQCQADFSYIQNGTTTIFTDLSNVNTNWSTNYSVTWLWDFGDGNTSTQQNPLHTYASIGSYIPCLTVTYFDSTTFNMCTSVYCDSISLQIPTPIWSEDFSNGFPSGWSSYSNNSAGGIATAPWKHTYAGSWGYWNTNQGTSAAAAINSTTASNGFLITDPDSANHYAYGQPSGTTYEYIESYFTTNAINLLGHTNVYLEFQQTFRFNNSLNLKVSISTDSINWTDYSVQGNTTNNTLSPDPQFVSLNISPVAGNSSTVYVRIGWEARVYFWMIDDMQIVSFPNVYGCTDSTAFNYNPLATIDDGSCIAVISGCMNPTALNFDSTANVDDGSCCLINQILQLGGDIDGEASGDHSGRSVSVSSDGNTVAIGANYNDGNGSYSGHVRVYTYNGSSWTQVGQDIDGEASGDESGYSVSLSSDGSTVAIGAPLNGNFMNDYDGHVRVYTYNGSSWTQLGGDIDGDYGNNARFGKSVSLSSDGNTLAIGAPNSNTNNYGQVRVYTYNGSYWAQLGGNIIGEATGDLSGNSVSLSSDGNTVAIGALFNDGNGSDAGQVRVYTYNGSSWTQLGGDIDGEAAGDNSGQSVSLSSDGNTVAIGATGNDGNGPYSGHVRVYTYNGSSWTQLGQDIDGEAADDFSGQSVSLSSDGNTVVIGAVGNDGNGPYSGHVRVYNIGSDCAGCTDSIATNYSPVAIIDDGSCLYIYGCTDSTAFNYNPLATIDDGSCGYCNISATFFSNAPSSLSNCNGYILSNSTSNFPIVSYNWINSQGNYMGNTNSIINLCNDAYILTVTDSVGCSITDTIILGTILGCTDTTALNYNWGANQDDGSCIAVISGCMDTLAINYDSLANVDDGSCCLINQILQLGGDIDGEAAYDESGWSVSLSSDGNTVAIGAPYNSTNLPISGHVRIYSFNGSNWTQVGQDIDGEAAHDQSGYSVSLSSDGNTVAIGAPYNGANANVAAGHVRVYTYNGSSWTQVGQDIDGEAAVDHSGWSVSLSSDGNTVAIGATGNDGNGSQAGHVRIYEWNGSNWTQLGNDIDGEEAFDYSGYSVSLSSDGNTVAIGAIGAIGNDGNGTEDGHVRVYTYNGSSWTQVGQDIDGEAAYDESGHSVSLSSDGNTVAIGAYGNDGNGSNAGHVRVYTYNGSSWTQVGQDIDGEASGDRSGWSVSLSSDGNTVAIGATENDGNGSNSGHVRVYNIGSCAGCMDPLALNYDSTVQYSDSSCIYPSGCTDTLAYNYDTNAITDDGSCLYCDLSFSIIVSQNTSPSVCDGFVFVSSAQSSNLPISYLWSNGSTQNNATNLCSGIYTLTLTDNVGCVLDTTFTIGQVIVPGCTDPLASNYNPLATIDDSSCVYPSNCTKPTPSGLNATEITHNRAKVNWADANTSNCMVEMYRVQYREQGTTTWSQKTALGSGLCIYGLTTTSKTLWNLSPSTTYEYRAKAWYCNTTGASSWSPIATFTTLDVCPNVDNFTVSTPTNTRATFSWTAPSSPYSFVRIKLRVDTTGATWLTAGGYGVMYPALTRNKNGLTPGQSYLASSRTWCDPNGGPYKATSWTPFIYWTQPGTLIRIESEDSRINNLTIYPNPSRDIFNITFQAEEKQDLKVRLLNVIGEELMVEDLQQFIGQYTKGIDLSNNAKGIYFLEIETNYGVINKKLILQ